MAFEFVFNRVYEPNHAQNFILLNNKEYQKFSVFTFDVQVSGFRCTLILYVNRVDIEQM